ncbi:MAG: apolipoprotein N-acyltransferase [Oligoflexia bacterium]|nr:apolipoprotein N-acyltransferase [Oligoflexia bacterium]
MPQSRLAPILACISALLTSLAWWQPGTHTSALLGWMGIAFLVACLRCPGVSYRALFAHGLICNALGFYWLFHTIRDFGGLHPIVAAGVFLLFIVLSANQQLLFLFLFKRLPNSFHAARVAAALAWVSAEFVSIRIFPWSLAHTQIAFQEFVQFADVLGASGLTFVLLWATDGLYCFFAERRLRPSNMLPLIVFGLIVVYGATSIPQHDISARAPVNVALIQGNVSIEEKHDMKYFTLNLERYRQLSEQSAQPGALIVWPETVVNKFIGDNVRNVLDEPRLPFVGPGVSFLVGALTYETQERYFNSAVPIFDNGTVGKPYHKQILMPFGEFTPFSSSLPWLKALNQTAADFTPGKEVNIFRYESQAQTGAAVSYTLSPLICYEDVVPELARQATAGGAEILVNLTNDAWFGDSVAPYQHNLIASFRAIENRRYLLRATNAGLTSIINPLGQTVAELRPFTEGVLEYQVFPENGQTLYTRFFGAWFNITVAAISLIACLVRMLTSRQ